MSALPQPLTALIAALGKLPGIGPRSAERIALHVVQTELQTVQELAQALTTAREQIGPCQVCGALTHVQPCFWCSDPKRDSGLLCVTERAVDILSLEKSGAFNGRYHVLGGKLSPINGIGPEDIRLAELDSRVESDPVRELILALPSDVEGDATSHFIAQRFRGKNVRVSRLAHGLPVGGGLEFADGLTLVRAIEGRRDVDAS